MGRWVVRQKYFARRDGQEFGPWTPGLNLDLSDFDAEWVQRDSPGTLTPYVEPAPEPEPEPEPEKPAEEPERDAAPAKDRMHRGGRRRAAS